MNISFTSSEDADLIFEFIPLYNHRKAAATNIKAIRQSKAAL